MLITILLLITLGLFHKDYLITRIQWNNNYTRRPTCRKSNLASHHLHSQLAEHYVIAFIIAIFLFFLLLLPLPSIIIISNIIVIIIIIIITDIIIKCMQIYNQGCFVLLNLLCVDPVWPNANVQYVVSLQLMYLTRQVQVIDEVCTTNLKNF